MASYAIIISPSTVELKCFPQHQKDVRWELGCSNHKNLHHEILFEKFSCTLDLAESVEMKSPWRVLNAFGNHMCTSCFIAPDLLRASLTPPHNISTLQWRAESADSVWLVSLICDERGREWDLVGRQRASWPGCSAPPSPPPAADAPANTTPATKSTFFLFLVLYFQKNNFQLRIYLLFFFFTRELFQNVTFFLQ